MNGYVCFYKGKQCEVFADCSYTAQKLATAYFQQSSRAKVKGYDITVVLAEANGKPITHSTSEI